MSVHNKDNTVFFNKFLKMYSRWFIWLKKKKLFQEKFKMNAS